MKTRIRQRDNGNVLICALCTIIIVSLIGGNVLVNCARHYNITGKQLKAWKEAMYAAEAGGDAGLDEIRNRLVPGNPNANPNAWGSDGWSGSGPWTKTFSGFENNTLSTIVTVDKLTDTTGTIPSSQPYYRIRATGIAKLLGLPRTGLSDQFFAGGPNFAANSASRGVGDTLLRKIDFKYDHFKATYGDGDGNGISLSAVGYPQLTRRIELVAVPKFYVFGGALRVVNAFNGPGNAGLIDSYSSNNPTNPNPPTLGGQPIAANTSSYWGPNPTNSTYLADAHDGDVAVATSNFVEQGPIWGDVTTNGGNVTHSGYQISGTIDNNVPFTVPPLNNPNLSTSSPSPWNGTSIDATGASQGSQVYVYNSSPTGSITINNGNATKTDGSSPSVYVTVVVNGDITVPVHVAKGVNAQIYFTGNMSVAGQDLDNQNADHQSLSYTTTTNILGIQTTNNTNISDPTVSRVAHMQFYGISPPAGVTQTININSPGNVFATFYAPGADMTLTGNPDIFSAVVARSFQGNANGGGNTGFHYDKWLNQTNIGVVTDYQIASYVEDVR